MSSAERIEQAWRQGQRTDVREDEMLAVLDAAGFTRRKDGGAHWLAEHPQLADHHKFGLPKAGVGRIKINCHYKRRSGIVHPFAVKDVLDALDYIRRKEQET
ncbi:MAG: hypothetical protein HND42_10980 [Armatimonadetes bacterium]|nr:hypothetical protein [Armatimonadota bacterium]NOG93752.1 hypothetical protein [Armatimonadota bacterium]